MKIIIAALLLFPSFLVQAQDDMQQYLKDTRQLVIQKKYKEALQRDIWFHDHALEHEPGIRGVRLSFALSDWEQLGKVYPPAMTALKNIRDRKTQQLINNSGPSDLFPDVAAINRVLKEDAKTINLFQLLAKAHPEIAPEYFLYIKDQLYAAKRYDIIHEYMGSPMAEYQNIKTL
jgi:hypothetical protein